MRKLFLIVLLITSLVGVGSLAYVNVLAESSGYALAGAVLNANTTWTKANSPYTLVGRVTIAYGATLTIEAGVTVNLDGNSLQIMGVLRAQGNNSDRITFTSQPTPSGSIVFTSDSASWNAQTGAGCIIENAVINATDVFVTGASPRISANSITSSILIDAGSPLISKNTIVGNIENLNSASPLIDNNSVTGSIITSGFNDATPSITNNNIRGEGSVGVSCYGINTYVANNVIANCSTGVVVESWTVIIERNNILNNSRGIRISESTGKTVVIRNNTITNNGIGIDVPGYPNTLIIAYNNIEKNSDFNLAAVAGNATNNWWGTTNQTAINQTINNPDKVKFIPFLTAPNPQATPDPNVSFDPPPVIPEVFPSSIVLALLATATLAGIATSKRNRKLKH